MHTVCVVVSTEAKLLSTRIDIGVLITLLSLVNTSRVEFNFRCAKFQKCIMMILKKMSHRRQIKILLQRLSRYLKSSESRGPKMKNLLVEKGTFLKFSMTYL